ncbi:MAG: hypothetical protein KF842_06795 [Caulobacter sp.]|nr:hypothetical protein [Caulobacter sp.]
MNPNTPTPEASLLPEPTPQAQVASTAPEASAAADKAAADKAAADKAAADKAKPKKARRGPPADGGDEARVTVILSTSRLSDKDGNPLRRGRAVSVPERRLHRLLSAGKVREASDSAIASALKLGPLAELA